MIVTKDIIKEPNQLKVVFTFEEVETPDGFTRYTDAIYLPLDTNEADIYTVMVTRLYNWIAVVEQIKENQRIDAENRAKLIPEYLIEFGSMEGFDEWYNKLSNDN
jgi:hypothetical protein